MPFLSLFSVFLSLCLFVLCLSLASLASCLWYAAWYEICSPARSPNRLWHFQAGFWLVFFSVRTAGSALAIWKWNVAIKYQNYSSRACPKKWSELMSLTVAEAILFLTGGGSSFTDTSRLTPSSLISNVAPWLSFASSVGFGAAVWADGTKLVIHYHLSL